MLQESSSTLLVIEFREGNLIKMITAFGELHCATCKMQSSIKFPSLKNFIFLEISLFHKDISSSKFCDSGLSLTN